jgi:hypothetical protein
MQEVEDMTTEKQEDISPEWTASVAPESSRPEERKSLPVGLNFMDELSKKIGAKRQSEVAVAPPQEENPEESQHLLSPKKEEPVEPVVAESRQDEGSVSAKKPPPPPPQAKTRPPPLPRKNSSESVATSYTSSQQTNRIPARKPSSESLPTVASGLTESRLARRPSSESTSVTTPDGRALAGAVAVTRSRSPGACSSEAEVSTPRSLSIRSCTGGSSHIGNTRGQTNDDLLLFSASTSSTLKAVSRTNDRQVYNTWQQKNIDSELQVMRGELNEARANCLRLEEQVRSLQQQNARLQQQLDIQSDGNEMLRDIRNRVRANSGSDSMDVPRFREPARRPGLCGSVCALFGRV